MRFQLLNSQRASVMKRKQSGATLPGPWKEIRLSSNPDPGTRPVPPAFHHHFISFSAEDRRQVLVVETPLPVNLGFRRTGDLDDPDQESLSLGRCTCGTGGRWVETGRRCNESVTSCLFGNATHLLSSHQSSNHSSVAAEK